jgi:hypothetical protein
MHHVGYSITGVTPLWFKKMHQILHRFRTENQNAPTNVDRTGLFPLLTIFMIVSGAAFFEHIR